MLLPPAELEKGCPTPVYANPRQVLRILKRREAKRGLLVQENWKTGPNEYVWQLSKFFVYSKRADWTHCSNLDSIIMLIQR